MSYGPDTVFDNPVILDLEPSKSLTNSESCILCQDNFKIQIIKGIKLGLWDRFTLWCSKDVMHSSLGKVELMLERLVEDFFPLSKKKKTAHAQFSSG